MTNEEKLDETPLAFGKYKGRTPYEIADEDPSYITWLRANVLPPRCSRALALACEQDVRDENGELEDEDLGWRP